ncbi:MAG: response regulator [Burkholderiales bacterium]|nr:response regulator [Burkholderiales bacterium]
MKASAQTAVIRVIDDDEDFRPAVSRLLRALGYAVRMYSSAAEYLDAQEDNAPGCILLDVHMPEMTGLELQTVLAGRKDVLPIILISGSGDVWDAARVTRAGAFAYFGKLTDQRELAGAIAAAIAAHRPSSPKPAL